MGDFDERKGGRGRMRGSGVEGQWESETLNEMAKEKYRILCI